MSTMQHVPVIDFQAISQSELNVAENSKLDMACRSSGFFYLENHGIEKSTLDAVWSATQWFFALPLEQKLMVERSEHNARGFYNQELTKNIRDIKEVFDFGHKPMSNLADNHPENQTHDGWNQWPEGDMAGSFRTVLWDYYESCHSIALKLLQTICTNLGSSPDTLTADFDPIHSSFIRLNYYPLDDPLSNDDASPASKPGRLGIQHHTDAGALTLLLQDEIGGLEVPQDGRWIQVEPKPGTLVINIGDIVQVWSNDQYRAALHRVAVSTSAERYSLPYFFNPAYSASYAPLESLLDHANSANYHPINWGDFRKERQHGDYGDYGSEIQIADFKVNNTE